MPRFAGILVACLVVCVPSLVGAEADLESTLSNLEHALQSEQNLSSELKDAFVALIGALREERADVARAATSVSAAPGRSTFSERVHPFADLRLRHEWDGRRGNENRNRERVRLRVGAEVDLAEEFRAGFRVRTGDPDDPRSPHHNFGSSSPMLGSLEFNLDRAYVRYRPSFLPGAWVVGGKFSHAFVGNPVYGELVWDADVQPEGLAGGYTLPWGENVDLKLTAGQYLLFAQDGADEFSTFVMQGSSSFRPTSQLSLLAALGWYRYGTPQPDGDTTTLAANAGNKATADGYLSDFHIVNPILSLTYDGWGRPITLAGEYVVNTGAEGDDNRDGFAIGASLGKLKKRGDWKSYYQFQRIEQESVFTPFAQDDFLQGTNFTGHVFGFAYRLRDRLDLNAWGLVSRPIRDLGAPNSNSVRLRLDLNTRF
jgi:hypothetical protein